MYAEERKQAIIEFLEKNSRADASELAQLLGISRETIRRDLKDLGQRGLIVKTHGGALAGHNSSVWMDIPIALRESRNSKIKLDLCAYAAQFINEYDNIFIDNSTTVAQIINFIPKAYHITLITNSIKSLLEIAKINSTTWSVIHLGGNFSITTLSTNSYIALNNLRMFKPTKAFLSCHGIDNDMMVTDSYMDDVELKKVVIESSQDVFLLADHTKFSKSGVIRMMDIGRFDHVITDDNLDECYAKRLKQKDLDLHLVKPSKPKTEL